ncbi:TPA: hypothetical protein M5605_002524 [Staphylococcus aureus]|nr:hypothetical protein [Staphylococcus aureus]
MPETSLSIEINKIIIITKEINLTLKLIALNLLSAITFPSSDLSSVLNWN